MFVLVYKNTKYSNLTFFFTVTDNRCFLESGGSAESFFVSEDQPVGAVVGKCASTSLCRFTAFHGSQERVEIFCRRFKRFKMLNVFYFVTSLTNC